MILQPRNLVILQARFMGFGFVEVLSSWSTGLALGVLVRFRNLQAQDPKEEAKSETRDWINTVDDSATLRSAASAWHAELALLSKPLLVVNIGGPSGNCSYGVDLAKQLAAMLQNVLWSCGSVRISFSRRTPEKVSKLLIREFSNNPKVYIWDGEGCNPHMGHLALADAFMITADSVSMLSEACSTGKPVYVIGAEHCTWKFTDFQNRLEERGVVRPFTGKEDMSKCWTYVPLNDTAEAASQVIKALAERGWSILI